MFEFTNYRFKVHVGLDFAAGEESSGETQGVEA
jgi:hypothetical protein